MNELFKKALLPGTKIQISTINKVLYEILTPMDISGVDKIIKSNKRENLYWLGGVDASKEGRARDADILKKNYHFLDFDIRANSAVDISDDEIVMTWDWIKPALESEPLLSEWSHCIFTGNGLHVYYFYDEVWDDTKERYADAISSVVEIAVKVTLCEKEIDKGCINIARLARLPGSINQKTGRKSFTIETHL